MMTWQIQISMDTVHWTDNTDNRLQPNLPDFVFYSVQIFEVAALIRTFYLNGFNIHRFGLRGGCTFSQILTLNNSKIHFRKLNKIFKIEFLQFHFG